MRPLRHLAGSGGQPPHALDPPRRRAGCRSRLCALSRCRLRFPGADRPFSARVRLPDRRHARFPHQPLHHHPRAEVHAPATEIGELWHLLAVGLPLDFTKTPPSERAPELAARCIAAGAYVAIAQDVFVNRSYKRSPIELGLFPRRPARKSGRAAPEAPVADGPERQWRSRLCRLAAKAPTDAILAQRSAGEWASPSPGEGSQHLVHRHDAAMRLGAARELGRSDIKRWVREAQQVSRSRLRFSRGGRRCRAIAGAARPREGSSPARAETPRPFWPAARSRARQARGRAGPPGLGRTRPRLPIWLLTPDKARRRHDNGLPWGELPRSTGHAPKQFRVTTNA